jgi:ABC-type branched-subunit amino acid transport system substrate-binding protein
MFMGRCHALVLGFTLCVSPFGGAQAGEESGAPHFLMGLLLPPEEAEGVSIRQGVELGIEQANQSAKAQVGLIIRGRVGQWGADGEEAGRMVLNDGVQGMIAPPGGSPAHLALQVSGRTATPVVALCPDSSVIGAGIPWMVCAVPGTIAEASALFALWPSKSTAAGGSWVALVPEDREGRETSKDLRKAAAATQSKLADPTIFDAKAGNESETIRVLLAQRPTGVLLWLEPEPAGRLAKQLRAAGFVGRLAGPSRLRCAGFLTAAGKAADGFLMVNPVMDVASRQVYQRFDAGYRARFGVEPDATAAYAYDAAMLLAAILVESGDKPARLAFPVMEDRPGASGRLKFKADGVRGVSFELQEYRSGTFRPYSASPAGREEKREPANDLDKRR